MFKNRRNEKMYKKIILMALILLFLLVSCATATEGTPISNDGAGDVYRYYDKEAGVVCWVFYGYYKGGIDCMPISQTKLDQ